MSTREQDWAALEARLSALLEEVEQAQVVNVATLLKCEQLLERGVAALEALAEDGRVLATAVVHLANARDNALHESHHQTEIIRRWHRNPQEGHA